jgi:hypothetical protein
MLQGISASLNRRSEYIGILPVVVSELKFGDIQVQIFLANLAVSADDAALQNRPEALNRVRVNCANDMLADAVVNDAMLEAMVKPIVSCPSIGAEKADAGGNGLSDKPFKDGAAGVLDDARNDVALTADCADYGSFAGIAPPAHADFLVPMPVSVVSTDEGFVNLNDPAELLHVLNESGSDLVAHEPSSLVGTEAHIAVDLEGAHALLRNKHQMGDSEPIFQRLIGVLKDGFGQVREAITVRRAFFALPMMTGGKRIDLGIATARANDAFRPAARYQVLDAIVVSLKHRVELLGGQLVDGLRTAAHRNIPRLLGGMLHV